MNEWLWWNIYHQDGELDENDAPSSIDQSTVDSIRRNFGGRPSLPILIDTDNLYVRGNRRMTQVFIRKKMLK